MELEFRKLEHKDYDQVYDICKDIWEGTDYLPQVFHKWVDDKGLFLAAIDKEKNKIVGLDKYSILYDGSGWLEGLRVHKDYRGLKIGKRLAYKLFDYALENYNKGLINKVAFCTHATNTESIAIMKELKFTLDTKYLLLLKEYSSLSKGLQEKDFAVENWEVTLEEFLNLEYFKRRNNLVPLNFMFQEPTKDLYEELKKGNCFVKINGYKGIIKVKGEAHFIAIDDSFEAIDIFMNYCLVKYYSLSTLEPLTSILVEEKKLIKKAMDNKYMSMNQWEADYLYYVYK